MCNYYGSKFENLQFFVGLEVGKKFLDSEK